MSIDPGMDYLLAVQSGNAEAIDIASKALNGQGTNAPTTPAATAESEQSDWDLQREYYRQKDQAQTLGQLKAIFSQYGLSSLFSRIEDYVRQDYTADTIALLLRDTPEYQQRFPAMKTLAGKGRAITEAEYINFEQASSGLERRYGLPQGMLMNNVTNLLENEVSVAELNDRVLLASAAAIQAPQELKDTFKNYYGIDAGGMTAYFLDPAIATPLLERQVAASQIGAEAARQGIGLDVYGAENLQNLGISKEQAAAGFSNVAEQKGLSTGRGDIATQQELIGAQFGTDAKAKESVERAIGARVGAFQGGGQFVQSKEGSAGLGSAATR
jgi:hypothetical protein